MKTRFALALIPALIASQAMANFTDVAQVVSATPIYDRVSTPRQECWTEQVQTYAPPSRTVETVQYQAPPAASSSNTGAGAILGAIIGGVVGHQFGNSSGGRDRGTAAGAVVGGLIGNSIETTNRTASGNAPVYAGNVQTAVVATEPAAAGTRSVERCRTVSDTREQVSGYNVTYRYGSQTYTTRLPYDPGQTLKVRVNVAPEIGR